ncbi:MAG: cyclase family protein [Firmicutes bacterium]|nr:cyclase family protein [Bacillota bacterium]
MYKYIDLSHTIEDGMPVYPGDGGVKLYQDRFLDKDGSNNSRLETGMHAGTHLDLPSHFLDSNVSVDQLAVERFAGTGCLLDVRNEQVIDMKPEYETNVQENDIVLLFTGFGRHLKSDSYFTDHPVVDQRLAEFFAAKKIKMVGMDLPSPDREPFEIHRILLQADILIMENLTSLNLLLGVRNFEVIAFPLKVKAEAALLRAVARVW